MFVAIALITSSCLSNGEGKLTVSFPSNTPNEQSGEGSSGNNINNNPTELDYYNMDVNHSLAHSLDTSWSTQYGATTAPFTTSNDDSCTNIRIDSDGKLVCSGFSGGATSYKVLRIDPENTSNPEIFTASSGNCSSIGTGPDNSVYCFATVSNDIAGEKIDSSFSASASWSILLNSSSSTDPLDNLAGFTHPANFAADSDTVNDSVVDKDGNSYVCGGTLSSLFEASTNSGYGGGMSVTPINYSDAYVFKINPQGQIVWYQQLGDNYATTNNKIDRCSAIDLDRNGDVIFVGLTEWDIENLTTGSRKMFLMKLSGSTGAILNTKYLASFSPLTGVTPNYYDAPKDLKVDVVGNIYIAGETSGSFADDTPDEFGIYISDGVNASNQDIILAKFDSNFTPLWAKQLGKQTIVNGYGQGDTSNFNTEGEDENPQLALDKYNRPYLVFTTRGHDYHSSQPGSSFGEVTAASTKHLRDPVIMKFNHATGDIYWIKQFGQTTMMGSGNNSGDDSLFGLAFDDDNNMYLSGYTTGSPIETNGGSAKKDMIFIRLNSPL